jgi:hypothetical protein
MVGAGWFRICTITIGSQSAIRNLQSARENDEAESQGISLRLCLYKGETKMGVYFLIMGVYFFVHWSSQPSTVSCHRMLLAGLRTQWFSSGKYRNLLGMPRRCNAVKVEIPCVATTR